MDESNGTCGIRLDSIGVENTEDNRRSYRELLVTTPGLGDYISGAILFEETLYQSCSTGKTMVEELNSQGIVAGIKVSSSITHHEPDIISLLNPYRCVGNHFVCQIRAWVSAVRGPSQCSCRLSR